jgi:acetyl-CoA carboxylase biotin carboxyl carrier protein
VKKTRNPSRPQKRGPQPGRNSAPPVRPASSNDVRKRSVPDQQRQIQDLIDLLKRNNLTELEWECATFRVRVSHGVESKPATVSVQERIRPAEAAPVHTARPPEQLEEATGLVTVTSPIVGTFYRAAAPDADPYVEENDSVKKGQVLCIVEAMKLMNEIESEVDGRIVKVLAESAKPVEYGQPLFLIDPSPGA